MHGIAMLQALTAAPTRIWRSRHIDNVTTGEGAAHVQHRTDALQENISTLDRHTVRSGHNDFQLMVAQATILGIMSRRRRPSKPNVGFRSIRCSPWRHREQRFLCGVSLRPVSK
jgi:hypothetical protein